MRLLELLSPNEIFLERTWRRERKRGEVTWIFEQKAYLDWASHDESALLWIRGNLGSGKTVAMANIFGHLSSILLHGRAWVLSVFCQSGTSHSTQSRWILGSVAHQLLHQQESTAADTAMVTTLEKYMGKPDAVSSHDITELIINSLGPSDHCFLLLDALDECAESEIKRVMKCLRLLISKRRFHVCWSSRNEPQFASIASAYMPVHNFLSMSSLAKEPEMAKFIETEL